MARYKVYLVTEIGEPVEYEFEAKTHYKAIEMAMDRAFEEQPDNRFALAGYDKLLANIKDNQLIYRREKP